jgi:hypothetical protein
MLTGTRKHMTTSLKQVGSDFLILFFIVGVMYGFRRSDTARLRYSILGGLACAILGMSFLGVGPEIPVSDVNGWNLLVLFLPLVAVYGAAFFYLLLDRIPFRVRLTRALAVGAFAALNVAPMIYTLLPPRLSPFPYPPYCAPYTRLVAEWFDKDEVGTSDTPWAMAWYGQRRTLWLPATVDEFYEIHDFVAPKNTQFMFLTSYMLDRNYQSEIVKGEYKGWASIVIRGQVPPVFPLHAATLIPPETDQILFADKVRWEKKLASEPNEKSAPGQPSAQPTNAPAPAPSRPAAP